ncbi:hypothetical protein M413DRAFT_20795 [Hebeloma cylindrosporum]|uniref:Uncharacterized protein n=1 Tax=Hebeloma cylindrosporum TaxID=76867 RepID=A0A0C3BUX4_HEBCY|nr:hypothetical protein M413DRAFT_20795 [Hebeloma cylindrosporum h7]
MSSSNINDPFVLASYTSSFRGKTHQKYTPGVYASSYKRPNKTNEFVSVAVQADGLHVLDLSGFSFLSTSSKYPVSLLALTSSHVLLAAVASQEINLLLWDMQFSVLLSSHTLAVPSALSSSQLHIRLLPGSQTPTKNQTHVAGQAILIVSSMPTPDSPTKSTSVLLVVPYSVPTTSTIAAAMGRGGAGKKWIRASEERTSSESEQLSAEEMARVNVLATMRTAMQGGRPQAAVAAFMKWAPQNDEVCLLITKGRIVQLLTRQTLFNIFSSGVPCVARWYKCLKSIELAFSTVLDISESELMETLQTVVSRHRETPATAARDAMDVDSPPSSSGDAVPSLPIFLQHVASYPTSRGPLVLAFRTYMKEPEDLMAVLQVLNTWLVRRSKMDERLLPTKKDLRKTEQCVWVVVGRKGDKDKKEDIPSLEKITEILQIILDASFLTLLQHQPSHKIIRSLSAILRPEIAFANTIEGLRGFSEPFALAQDKAVKESLVTPQEREREKQKGDWRQRRKGVGAAPGVGADIGVYKLEELVL